MKKTIKWILGIVAAVTAAVTGVLIYCYNLAFRRNDKRLPIEGSAPTGEQYDPFKEVIEKGAENILGAPYEKVTILSQDGIPLVGRYYHVKDGEPVSIIFHGYRSNIGTDCNGGYYLSTKRGCNVLAVYQRAHRESGGKTITFGVKERFDCLDWIAYVNERFGENTKILLMGLSMGAATVLMAAGLDLPANVKGVMADCGFSSPKEILQEVIKQMKFPLRITYFFVRMSARIFGHFDPEEASAVEALKEAKVPVLIIHGDDDRFVPSRMSHDNYDACASTKEILIVPGAGHGLSYCVDAKAYEKAVNDFMDRVLEFE
jgi:fermentation-respiration switch protein FrsA (DUF1100 family)